MNVHTKRRSTNGFLYELIEIQQSLIDFYGDQSVDMSRVVATTMQMTRHIPGGYAHLSTHKKKSCSNLHHQCWWRCVEIGTIVLLVSVVALAEINRCHDIILEKFIIKRWRTLWNIVWKFRKIHNENVYFLNHSLKMSVKTVSYLCILMAYLMSTAEKWHISKSESHYLENNNERLFLFRYFLRSF